MAKHRTFFGKIFGVAWDKIKSVFDAANLPFLEAVVKITEGIKHFLNSGIVDVLTYLIPGDLDNKLIEALRKKLPVIMAQELLLKKAAEGPITEEAANQLTEEMLLAFGGLSDEKKARFYTTVAAEIFIFGQEHAHGEKVTFGQAARSVEKAWQAYQLSIQNPEPAKEGMGQNG